MKISTTHNEYPNGSTATHRGTFELANHMGRTVTIVAEGDSELAMLLRVKAQMAGIEKDLESAEAVIERKFQAIKSDLTPCRMEEAIENEEIRSILVNHEEICHRESFAALIRDGVVKNSDIVFILERHQRRVRRNQQ